MKFILCILALYGLTLSACSEYNAFGITKSSAVILDEFAGAINKILGSIGYIQFYDVSKHIKVFPVSPEVTLTNIEMSNLKITTQIDPSQLSFSVADATAFIKGESLALAMGADLSLKWTYKVGGAVIYRGTYTCKLHTEKPELEFSFVDGSAKTTGKVAFGWKITDSSIKGFGAYNLVLKAIDQIIAEELYPVFGEELNRYNDIIVSSMIYNYFYRSIPIPLPETFHDKLSMKNVFKNFWVHHSENGDYLSFAFSSSLYFAIQHLEIPFNGTFVPSEDYSKNVTLYFGAKQMDELFELLRKSISSKTFTITPEVQERLFGYKLTISTLATFYPKLSEEHNPEELMDFTCTLLEEAGHAKTYPFACKFVLHKDPEVTVFDIEHLDWSCDFRLSPISDDENNKEIKLALGSFSFTDIKIKQPLVPVYVAKQFLSFIQPMSKYPEAGSYFQLKVVGDKLNWKFDGHALSDAGDITLSYIKA